MIVIGSLLTLALFLVVGWAISTEMFQQRLWRRRAREGDVAIVSALIQEALGTWRRARTPKDVTPGVWSAVQAAQLLAVTRDSATLSVSAEPEFQTVNGERVQVGSALDEAIAVGAKLVDMMLYDVPNLRLGSVRVDVYSTFTRADGIPVQQPILTTTADRATADEVFDAGLTPIETLSRFHTHFQATPEGQPVAIDLAPVNGALPDSPNGKAS